MGRMDKHEARLGWQWQGVAEEWTMEILRQSACLLARKLHFIRKRAAGLALDRYRTVVSRPQRIFLDIGVALCYCYMSSRHMTGNIPSSNINSIFSWRCVKVMTSELYDHEPRQG
jgi:hypothetical protein